MSEFSRVAALIALTTDGDVSGITPQTRFADLENWDSVAAMRLIPQIESDLSIKLPIRRYLSFTHVEELVDLVRQEALSNG